MTTERKSTSTILIVTLLVANLGLSSYIAFRPQNASDPGPLKEVSNSEISETEATELAESLVPLYNGDDLDAFYDEFDPLAKVQFSREEFLSQVGKLQSLIGRVERFAFSHATAADSPDGRTFYVLRYKVSLSGGQLPTGDMIISVSRKSDGLALIGFRINVTSGRSSL